MTPLQADMIYKQGCLDGATRFAGIAIEEMEKRDSRRVKSKHKSSIQMVRFLQNNIDMDFARNGYPGTQKFTFLKELTCFIYGVIGLGAFFLILYGFGG